MMMMMMMVLMMVTGFAFSASEAVCEARNTAASPRTRRACEGSARGAGPGCPATPSKLDGCHVGGACGSGLGRGEKKNGSRCQSRWPATTDSQRHVCVAEAGIDRAVSVEVHARVCSVGSLSPRMQEGTLGRPETEWHLRVCNARCRWRALSRVSLLQRLNRDGDDDDDDDDDDEDDDDDDGHDDPDDDVDETVDDDHTYTTTTLLARRLLHSCTTAPLHCHTTLSTTLLN